MTTAIAYYRVSTAKQGNSGLGLESQQEQVRKFCEQEGIELIDELIEVETGKGEDALDRRPVLKQALAASKKQGSTIIVAKLDRLSRSVHFISGLMTQKVPFISVQHGKDADPFMLHLYAALGEQERNLISERTKQSLSAAKARGVKLGNRTNLKEAQLASQKVNATKADEFAARLAPTLQPLIQEGLSYRAIAKRLDTLGVRTARGGTWQAAQVSNIAQRLNLQAKLTQVN